MTMKPRGFESPVEQYPQLKVVANLLQIQLMPLAYKQRHPELEIVDMSDRELRNVVAQEWIEQYAGLFREYIEDHPREAINIHDPETPAEFLEKLERETVH